jgi:hypothetical protein
MIYSQNFLLARPSTAKKATSLYIMCVAEIMKIPLAKTMISSKALLKCKCLDPILRLFNLQLHRQRCMYVTGHIERSF